MVHCSLMTATGNTYIQVGLQNSAPNQEEKGSLWIRVLSSKYGEGATILVKGEDMFSLGSGRVARLENGDDVCWFGRNKS
ncbi:hypothetical protein MTR_2g084885 [Medicago truncatula]|uniref:Uncharacterized protein n=1 Tax=Medicago truncatula TaxID=3880 RepID=A0A072VB09_MEDTR|nr:hypothetical protein MTR_2g084885 [Medicago truncatula]